MTDHFDPNTPEIMDRPGAHVSNAGFLPFLLAALLVVVLLLIFLPRVLFAPRTTVTETTPAPVSVETPAPAPPSAEKVTPAPDSVTPPPAAVEPPAAPSPTQQPQ